MHVADFSFEIKIFYKSRNANKSCIWLNIETFYPHLTTHSKCIRVKLVVKQSFLSKTHRVYSINIVTKIKGYSMYTFQELESEKYLHPKVLIIFYIWLSWWCFCENTKSSTFKLINNIQSEIMNKTYHIK